MIDPVIYHIYSKPDCVWCDKAKELLDHLNLTYEEHDVSSRDSPHGMFFRLKGYKTVPQCYEGPTHIGGYSQLEGYLTGKIVRHDT